MLKRCLCMGLLLMSSSLFARQFTSFDEITQGLAVGKSIRVVVNVRDCTVNDPNEYKMPQSTMVVKPTSLLFTDELISFDGTKFAHGRPPLPSSGFLQRASFILKRDGSMYTTIDFFNAETNKKSNQWKDILISCHLGQGVKIFQY